MRTLIPALLLSPTLALANAPEAYQQDLWRIKKDTATAGAIVAGIGIAASGTGIALDGNDSLPTEMLMVSGALATASGATVVSIAALSARYDPLDRSTSPTGAYLALTLVGASAVGLTTLAVTNNPETHDALLYGSAGVAASAMIPAIAQLAANGSSWNNRATHITWAPMATPNHVGGFASVRF